MGCDCSLDKCADSIASCLADANCAKSQDCALSCPCSDNACMLKCAASSPSAKALPVASCVNKQCATELKTADIDCTQSACPSQCDCSLDKCADSIASCFVREQAVCHHACLSDPQMSNSRFRLSFSFLLAFLSCQLDQNRKVALVESFIL